MHRSHVYDEPPDARPVPPVYTYGLNRISQSQASGTSFYGYDGHGNVRLLTDSTGAVTDRYDYDAFGNVVSQIGTTSNVYLYSGEQNDSNLGLYYLRARFLKADTGRFGTSDPFLGWPRKPMSLHPYVFADGDPVNRIDPSGHFTSVQTIGAISIHQVLMSVAVNALVVNRALEIAKEAVEKKPGANWVVRGGVATAQQLKAGTQQHLGVPDLFGFSVQYEPGRTVVELATAGRFPHRKISYTTDQHLYGAATLAEYAIAIVKSPGIGYHHTVSVPDPLPDDLAEALSVTFVVIPNPANP